MNKSIFNKISNVFFYGLMAFLLITGITAKRNNEIPSFFGYSFMHVISASMEPYIMTDDVAIGQIVKENDEIAIGDVYIYENKTGLKIIHRIIDEDENGDYIFKGDNNDIRDYNPVKREQIEFKYLFKIPYLGHLVSLFKNKYFYAILIAVLLAIEALNTIKNKMNK